MITIIKRFSMVNGVLKPNMLVFPFMMIATFSSAQTSINSGGGSMVGVGGSISCSIGQVLYTSIKDTSASISMGVQQTYDITKVGLNETTCKISLVAYPNPTTNDLTLVFNEFKTDKLTYQLTDIQGKLLLQGHINAEQTLVNTKALPTATYFLQVYNQQNQQVQLFKIIKK